MELLELVEQVPGFDAAAPKEKMKLFAWWLHTHSLKELFSYADIRNCYNKLHIDEPPALATYVKRMAEARDLLSEKGRFKLARSVRSDLDKRYGVHQSIIVGSSVLADLPSKVPNLSEKTFLDEALKCYRARAFRACIVMTWNLAYNHLLNWLLADATRLAQFNATIVKRNSKKPGLRIAKYNDFEELKEREVIDIASSAGLYNSSVYKILKDKLDKRNIAAHPSNVVVTQPQADDTITDLVNNVVLTLT